MRWQSTLLLSSFMISFTLTLGSNHFQALRQYQINEDVKDQRPIISNKERRWLKLSLFLSNLVDEAKNARKSQRRTKRLTSKKINKLQQSNKNDYYFNSNNDHRLNAFSQSHEEDFRTQGNTGGLSHPSTKNNPFHNSNNAFSQTTSISNDDDFGHFDTHNDFGQGTSNHFGQDISQDYTQSINDDNSFGPDKDFLPFNHGSSYDKFSLKTKKPSLDDSSYIINPGKNKHKLSHNLAIVEKDDEEYALPHISQISNNVEKPFHRPHWIRPTLLYDARRRSNRPIMSSSIESNNSFRRPNRFRSRPRTHLYSDKGNRRGSGPPRCPGKCDNAVRCLVQGGKAQGGIMGAACPGFFQVCCTSWRPPPPRTASGPPFGPPVTSVGRILGPISYSRPFSSSSSYISPPSSNLPRRPRQYYEFESISCGVSSHAQSKIMGGSDAGYGQFPWTALIEIHGPGIDKECSGSLVHNRFVLTAGHCTQYCLALPNCNREVPQHEITYKVRLGEYDLGSNSEFLPVEMFTAIDVLRHPDYRNVMRQNGHVVESEPRYDIALLLLDRPVHFGPTIAPICLPADPQEARVPASGVVVGWGRLGKLASAPHAQVLQAASLPVLSDFQCLIETELDNFDDQFCAGGKRARAAPCPGDSGGAFQTLDKDNKWTLVGVVSNGPSVCGAQPVVFHKLATSIQWIRAVIRGHENNLALP